MRLIDIGDVVTLRLQANIAPNGLSVLRDLDEAIFAQVANSGYPVSHFELKSAYGWSLARICATNHQDPELHTVLIGRQRLWDCLRDHVPDDAILNNKIVVGLSFTRDQKSRMEFADGSPGLEADLVIGADGAKSVVKRYVTGNGTVDEHPAVFDGLIGVGGFVPSSYLSENEPRGTMTVTFGSQGFFGYGPSTIAPQSNHFAECIVPMGDEAVWWSTYECKDLPDTRNFDQVDIRRQLRKRHAGWRDPVIQKIVDEAVVDSIYPTWIMPDLPTWHARGVVLIGDAAHAMQPSSGQGASQGLEDAQILSMFLAYCLEKYHSQSAPHAGAQIPGTISAAVDQASKNYFEIRQPRVKKITDRAKQMGDLKRKKGFFEEWFTYLILWIIGKLPVDSYTRQVFNDLPVNEARKIIKNDKAPIAIHRSYESIFE
ncbi:MAG: hypothetical protein L6R42_004648 [Xanthoria sp. 1 TBL-2021]|nr:MAG: hypothetical protein L6R42_004648 [Xanthoria sp. 1 TBL-2021]